MQTIGLLGGMSWESTAEYYRLANTMVRARLGGVHSARMLIDSVDFADIEQLQAADNWAAAGELLAARALSLQQAGAELLLLGTNTMHIVADTITAGLAIPFLHIGDTTALALRRDGVERVGLLGTRFTMEKDFYTARLQAHGISTLIPHPAGRDLVHGVIYEELVRGVVSESSRGAFVEIIEELRGRGAQAVVLGCTEIELLIQPSDSPIPVYPTARLHVEAAIAQALG